MNVEELAEEQYGIVTRAQAHAYLSDSAIDRRLARRRWIPVFPGVYRVSGAPVTARQRALAVVLWAGKGAVLSHLAAGRLLRLDGIPRPLWLDVTVDRSTGLTAPEVVVHRAALVRSDRVVVDGIPCTNAARTLIDCAPFVDAEIIETAFEAARRSGLASVRSVAQRLAQGRPGSAAMRSVLERVEARPRESRLEVKFANLVRSSGLPRPEAQLGIGRYRVDFAWAEQRLVCECDGFHVHGNRVQWKRDRRRVAAIEAYGWRVLHVTWDDVTKHPAQTVDRLALVLSRAA